MTLVMTLSIPERNKPQTAAAAPLSIKTTLLIKTTLAAAQRWSLYQGSTVLGSTDAVS